MKHIIQKPVITEKTLLLASRGWYTFAVGELVRKPQAASAIEDQYNVNVVAIKSIAMHGKMRRVGKRAVHIKRPDWKKMIVRLKSGQKIDIFDVTSAPEEKQKVAEKSAKDGSASGGK